MITQTVLDALLDGRTPDPNKQAFLAHFFKTGPGGYGEGDEFIGVRNPEVRKVAAQFEHLSLSELEELLENPIHEVRLLAVVIMANQAARRRTTDRQKQALFELYLRRSDRINNWDIIDVSCRQVVGGYLLEHPEKTEAVLRTLAVSDNMWERRIAMVSTWQFIRQRQLDPTFMVAELLLGDRHDLIHKAVGWMLREAGKRDAGRLRDFLHQHIAAMPRTALRYAIERFDPEERAYFLKLR